MTVLPIIATLALGPAFLAAEKWLAGAARRNRGAPAEDRLFRNGLRMILRSSATFAVGAGLMGIWRSIPQLPQAIPGNWADLPDTLAVLIAMAGGGQMAAGLLLAHWRYRRRQYMDPGLSLLIVTVLGGAIGLASALPFGVAWLAKAIS